MPTDALTLDTPSVSNRRPRGAAIRDVLVFSLCISATAALAALAYAQATGTRWALAFVVLRWILVAVMLVIPALHQVAVRLGARSTLPWVLRTPGTALLLACESILFDIIAAQFH